ncbi:type III PLP-dependent enzyme domain-containing protein [Glutamicibacter arilaitensis]|uniref:hypothetical protein n=1 Tax=Glutamicibacter arilaitensis TaxID=256701 RepID=UPI001CB8B706|nr:hypothetical protein [Glutamicibacter arilaitensis]
MQTNKAKFVAKFADEFHALDSLKLAETLQRRLELEDRTLEVFIQVNTSGKKASPALMRPTLPACSVPWRRWIA